ncbi:hypothetical protein ACLEJQ_02470 [Pseudomonas sp. SMV71]|uniref:hypothetical protein n=1 Tax=Pseudomonas sp. SMV71 TaxID=3390195 RepID=UPI003F8674E7
MTHYPVTPDGRYFVVKGRLWRCTNPHLSHADRDRWVKALMDARRSVKLAKADADDAALAMARSAVNQAKVALGERAAPWWDDGAPDVNQCLVVNTRYADWYAELNQAY